MAIRVQRYDTQPRNLHAGAIDPGFAQPLIRDAGRSTESDLLHEMARAGMQITEVGIREYVKDQSTAVAAALNDYRRQLNEERERYTTENKGQDAVNAGEHFDTFARETAKPLAEKFSGRAREMFLRDAAATGLHFTEQGQAYGRREKEAWQKSVFEGDMSETLNAIAGDPGNAEFVQQSLTELKQRMVDMTPGLDHRAMEADLNRKVAGVTIDALLARDNVGGAREAFGQYRELLGAAAPQFEARIRAKGRELESRAQAESERRANETALSGISAVLADTAGMSDEERNAAVFEVIAQEPDRKRRNAMLRVAHDELAFESTRRKAQSAAQGRALFEQAQKDGLSPLDAGKFYNDAKATPEARAYAAELTFGKAAKEGPENRAALRQGKMLVDMGELSTPEQREAYAINYGLTNAQVNSLLDYGGKDADLPISRAQRIYKSLGGDELPEGMYDTVVAMLPPGRKPTDRELEALMSNLMMEGEIQGGGIGYGRDRTLFEAGHEGMGHTWLPNMEDADEERQLDAQLAEKKIALTSFNRRKLKKLHMGYVENRPWEK